MGESSPSLPPVQKKSMLEVLDDVPYLNVGLTVVGACALLSLVLLLSPMVIFSCCLREQNLKKKYAAEWAIVTGGSSGIGKAIVDKLCSQGINVIIVAYPDKLLPETAKEMRKKYTAVQVLDVGADLSNPSFMDEVKEVTKDKTISLLFCNAGFMISGFFADCPNGKNQANISVNVTSHVSLAHEYINRMLSSQVKGAVFFTSSPAWMLPGPSAALYAGTKAFVSHFGVSIAAELKSKGVDVCVVHPSPVASRFYDQAADEAFINFFKSTAQGPEVLVNCMFACVGRLTICNQGYFPKVMGFLHKVADYTFLSEITVRVAHTTAAYKIAEEAGRAHKNVSNVSTKKSGNKSRNKRSQSRRRTRK